MIYVEHGGASVQCLSTEDTTECTVVLLADLSNDSVHRPSIQLLVREDLERHAVLLLISFDCLGRINVKLGLNKADNILTSRESSRYPVIPSSIDNKNSSRSYWYRSLSVFMTYARTVESKHMESDQECEQSYNANQPTFTTRSTDSYTISRFEQLSFRDSIVHLGFEDIEETFLAYLLPSLWPFQDGSSIVTKSTVSRGHDEGKKMTALGRTGRRGEIQRLIDAHNNSLVRRTPIARPGSALTTWKRLLFLRTPCPARTGNEGRNIRRRRKKSIQNHRRNTMNLKSRPKRDPHG